MWEEYVIRQAKLDDSDEIANLEKLCFSEKKVASKAAFFYDIIFIYAG